MQSGGTMALTFAKDILPLFRPKDINCMANFGVSLDDANYMCDATGDAAYADHANAREVFSKLSSGAMPPDGAWPAARVAIFQQWMADGFRSQ